MTESFSDLSAVYFAQSKSFGVTDLVITEDRGISNIYVKTFVDFKSGLGGSGDPLLEGLSSACATPASAVLPQSTYAYWHIVYDYDAGPVKNRNVACYGVRIDPNSGIMVSRWTSMSMRIPGQDFVA